MLDPTTACKVFSAEQIRNADRYTIEHEPIASIDLMERAANACTDWISTQLPDQNSFLICCGTGNNGGDGLAIARQLAKKNKHVDIIILDTNSRKSDDFSINLSRIESLSQVAVHPFNENSKELSIQPEQVLIDALFGTGLHSMVTGTALQLIEKINCSKAKVISIDLPSGLFADGSNTNTNGIVNADITLSFQFPKLAFFLPEFEQQVGRWEVLDIGLSAEFIAKEASDNFYLTEAFIRSFRKMNSRFSHKGSNGHALLFAGSYGKMGAAVMAAQACLKSGAGLLSISVPENGVDVMQISTPEAMVLADTERNYLSSLPELANYEAIGIGPGLGQEEQTAELFEKLLSNHSAPLVIDADALNLLAKKPTLFSKIGPDCILTPHPKELDRLIGTCTNTKERFDKQLAFSKKHKTYVILKGANTRITTPDGCSYYNSTGNEGMAKGGNGDVLTGLITGLLAQAYTPMEASLMGVYVHGLAGDLAAKKTGKAGMTAMDTLEAIPAALQQLEKK